MPLSLPQFPTTAVDYNLTNAAAFTFKSPLTIAGGSTLHTAGHIFIQNGYNLFAYGFIQFPTDTGKITIGAASDVGLARVAAGVMEINNGTAGALRDLKVRNVITTPTTVATLTAAATAGSGARSFVTDATATVFLSVAAGGGSNKVPVVSDGSNWLIG
jgi:hypothetical protein